MVVADEPVDAVPEPTQVAEQSHACLGMTGHELELVVGQCRRLAEHRRRHGQLAHVVQETTERKPSEPRRRQPELLTHLDRAERDAARVLFRRRVLLAERDEQRTDVGAEERLFLQDELDGPQVAEQGPRSRRPAVQVPGDDAADEHDADELEAVPEPPAEVPVGLHERRHERGSQPDDPRRDEKVRDPMCEAERAQRP